MNFRIEARCRVRIEEHHVVRVGLFARDRHLKSDLPEF
jgi:hypothetical protein